MGISKKLTVVDSGASIWIDYTEAEGPFFRDYSQFEKILGLTSQEKIQAFSKQSLKETEKLLNEFAFVAFRHRKPAPQYIQRLLKLYQDNRNAGQKHEAALVEPLAIILSSPSFLYLHESSNEQQSLDTRNFAIRLAYFLWSAPPDAELYRVVEAGNLDKSEVLRSQIERMLDDPKSEAFYQGFVSQWAELERFREVSVDPNLFPRFNNGIRDSAYQETIEFFKTLVKENLPVTKLIDSNFVTINSILAEHYELNDVKITDFAKVKLPADSNRGGLLGQVSFLTAGSTGERSSPVIRGALVMEKLLHDKPSPPPPNVPELAQASQEPLPIRDIVALHQTKPQCASCHVKMDQIGFGLENFDAIGRWRETEKVGRKQVSINPTGKLPGGGEFTNLRELKRCPVAARRRTRSRVDGILAFLWSGKSNGILRWRIR